jgi:antitoxin (DNA-binding transcriptional repressor) of toxin-antitoxin stability system
MTTATIEEAQAHLATLIAQLKPGEEVMIVERDRPVARLVGERSTRTGPRQPGSAIGKLTIVEDDDAHLEDFREYMP